MAINNSLVRRCTLSGLLVLMIGGCSESDLRRIWKKNQIQLAGHFCTEDPKTSFSARILFVLDSSRSLAINDPDFLRGLAVQEVFDRYSSYLLVSFGMIRFAQQDPIIPKPQVCSYPYKPCTDQLEPLQSAFTADSSVLKQALLAAKKTTGDRTYLQTLQLVRQLIQNEIQLDPILATETKYLIVFFSDGLPCPAEEQSKIFEEVDELSRLGEEKTAKLVLHTAQLEDLRSNPETCGNSYTAEEILKGMAEHGGGKFTQFEAASEIDFQNQIRAEMERTYELVHVIAENRNTRLMALDNQLLMAADSDGDGLCDEKELILGTDPMSSDTDSDGCGDLIETKFEGMKPLIPGYLAEPKHCYCPENERGRDSDGDGLLDCEEFYLGTKKFLIDTDGDFLSDGLEFRSGSHPSDPDIGIYDFDEDGVPDWDEVAMHRLPNVNENKLDPWLVANGLGYSYSVQSEGPPVDGVTCYLIEVSNIPLMSTEGSEALIPRDLGQNDLEISFFQKPTEEPEATSVIRIGTFSQFVFESGETYPQRKKISMMPSDLRLVH